MRVADFDYVLPAGLIAQHPLERRDASRMLIIDRNAKTWTDSTFSTLPDYLRENDVLVLNNTRVFPARLRGRRTSTTGVIEVLLIRPLKANVWEALCKPARRLHPGVRIGFEAAQLRAEVLETREGALRLLRFEGSDNVDDLVERFGETPLPPYIKRSGASSGADRERYQTVYAKSRGAIAAPTAGLHFTEKVFDLIRQRGVSTAEITLHVGYGTFEPVRVDEVAKHRVAPERFSISGEAATRINDCRKTGGCVVAVGTTTTRALESSVTEDGFITPCGMQETNMTILPGHKFRAVDGLLTNFHLPRSSLLIMVAAFAGRELILAAYRHAVASNYRFYSYGDCMLIL